MKKLSAILLAALMLLAALPALALSEGDVKAPYLGGYIVGNKNGAAYNEWIGFYADDPQTFDIYSSMDMTYAAAYYDGYVYGYYYGYDSDAVLHTEFYRKNAVTGDIVFPEGASAGGEFVFGMAYSYADNTMYALCNENNPYIASVDLATGALTRVVTIQCSGTINLGVQTFAINAQGEFLALSFSAISAKLVKIDRNSGAASVILDTGYDTYYAQSMVYRHADNCIYWAHADNSSNYNNGLYVIDLNNNSLTYKGVIGTDLELTGLYIAEDDQGNTPEPPVEPTYYTVTFVDWDGSVLSVQQVEEGEAATAPADPTREGYTFIGWDVDFDNVSSNLTVTAQYEENAPAGLQGDVNCDGVVDSSDLTLAAAYAMNAGTVTAQGILNGDMNGDGVLNSADLSALYALIQG